MVDAGQLALIIALVVTAYAAVGSFVGSWQRVPDLTASARYGFYSVPLLLLVATAALVYAFVTRDFSVRYVAENSNLAMPHIYTWVAFYAGNAGSLLYLALVLATVSTIAVLTIRKRLPHTTPYALGTMALILAFFLGIMLFLANPLERLPIAPPTGRASTHSSYTSVCSYTLRCKWRDWCWSRCRSALQWARLRRGAADATNGWTWAGYGAWYRGSSSQWGSCSAAGGRTPYSAGAATGHGTRWRTRR